jgi:hypothetical protein
MTIHLPNSQKSLILHPSELMQENQITNQIFVFLMTSDIEKHWTVIQPNAFQITKEYSWLV